MLDYNAPMIRIFKVIAFLANTFFIVASELAMYAIFRDYSKFIDGIAHRLASINILYVKVFQAIALNHSLIDDKMNNKLLQYTDNAPWNWSDVNLYELIEMSDKYNLLLKDGFEKPINSGMISLVFKAYQRETGLPVIIKMKRNNIERKLIDSIQNLQTFMYLLSFIPLFNKYQLLELFDKNIDIIKHQINFEEEVENINRIKHNCKNLKYVKIPYVYEEVTKFYPNIILMEYIDGIKINEIKEVDYEGFAKQVMKFGFVTAIVHGVTHGDLHSGNILFIKDVNDEKYPYKIGVIDFGIIYEIEQNFKSILFDILTQLFDAPPKVSAIKLLNSGLIDPPNVLSRMPKMYYEHLINFMVEIIEETLNNSKEANQMQIIYRFIPKLKEFLTNPYMSSLGIRPSDDFVKIQLVLAMTHGVTITLCKDNFMSMLDQVINELFHTNMIL